MIYDFQRFNKNVDGRWTDNTLPPHGFFTPYSSIRVCLDNPTGAFRRASDRSFLLTGEWRFAYVDESATRLNEDDVPFFTAELPFFFASETKNAFLAKKDFEVFDESKQHVLSFAGVKGAFELYVNGAYVGASLLGAGSFDVTDKVSKGSNELLLRVTDNELAATVDRNAAGPIGLTGEVALTYRSTAYLEDYYFSSKTDGAMKEGTLELSVGGDADAVSVVFCKDDEILSDEEYPVEGGAAKAVFVGAFETYSSEEPTLYDAYIRVFSHGKETECTRVRLAFNETVVKGGALTIGDVPVALYGVKVKRPVPEILDAVRSLNLNAVYCESSAISAAFLASCAERGVYVIEEFAFGGASEESKKKKKDKASEDAADEYYAAMTDAAYAAVKSEPAVIGYAFGAVAGAFASAGVQEFADGCARPVIGIDVGKEGAPAVRFVKAEQVKPDALQTIADDAGVAAVIVDGWEDLMKEDGASTQEAVFVKYAFRPYRAQLCDNRTIRIRSVRRFRTSEALSVTVTLVKGVTETVAATWEPVVKPGEERDFSMYLGDYDETSRVKVRFEEYGKHVATETLRILPEVVRPEDVKELKVKQYTYTIVNTAFFLEKPEENTLTRRSYFIPCSSESVCDLGKFYDADTFGDRTFTLTGEWDFCYYPGEAPRTFTWGSDTRTVVLPSSWESAGVEAFACDDGYPFKADVKKTTFTERADNKNAVGIYRKIVNVGDTAFKYVLSFRRVGGSLELQINGKYVGFSLLGRAEFDVSEYLVTGENEIVCIVKKFTPASMLFGGGFRATGILGEVMLTKSGRGGLRDYAVSVKRLGGEYAANIRLRFFENADKKCIVSVKRKGKTLMEQPFPVKNGEATVRIIGDFLLYNDEKPVLYDVYVKTIENGFVTECVKFPLAFNVMATMGDTVYYNEAPLKLRGVAYNPVYNARKQLMTVVDYRRDLALIKEYGFNAVRPTVPVCDEFYQFALALGLYVVEDVGIDTSACGKKDPKARDAVMNASAYALAAEKIASEAFAHTKNYPNVVGYYLAENGATTCGKRVLETLRKLTDRPVFCLGENVGDGFCASFPAVNDVVDMINEAMNKRPVFLAEYASGNGVGCATINEYEELFRTSCCVGGFVGYFVDDVIDDVGTDACGIFTAERVPYPCADALRYVYRPLRSELTDGNAVLEVTNTAAFTTANNVYISLNVVTDGILLSRTRLNINVPPKTTKKYDVFVGHEEGDMFLNVEYREVGSDRLLYTEQHPICAQMHRFRTKDGVKPLEVTEVFDCVEVAFDCGYVRFNKRLGAITDYVLMGKEVLKADSVIDGGNAFCANIFRPFSRNIKKDHAEFATQCKSFALQFVEGAQTATVEVQSFITEKGKEWYIVQDEYTVNANGVVEVRSALTPLKKGLPPMDCFGKQIRLNNEFGNVAYYGNGPTDNYIDMCEHTVVGVYNLNVDKTFETLPVLQECGNRTNVRYAVVRDNDGCGVVFAAKNVPYQLRVSPFSDEEIIHGRLSGERPGQSGVYVDVNAFVCGAGTSENGYPMPQYVVRSGEHLLRFDIIPVHALQ